MKKYTLENSIESLLNYISAIDKNGWCICRNEFDDCALDQDKKDLIVSILLTHFESQIENDPTQENLEDRANAIEELHRHSYYSNKIFCEYFHSAFPYIMKNDRTLLDADEFTGR